MPTHGGDTIPASMRYLLTTLLLASSALAEVTVLRHFTLIDGTGRVPLPDAAMVVENGRIQWVGPDGRVKPPAGAQTGDLAGQCVLPGLINLHGHLGNTKGLAQDPKNFTRAHVERHL